MQQIKNIRMLPKREVLRDMRQILITSKTSEKEALTNIEMMKNIKKIKKNVKLVLFWHCSKTERNQN